MFGERMVASFEWVKDRMDPAGLLNPNRLVRPPKMDDRSLFRYPPDSAVPELESVFDWSAYPGAGGGFQGAVEMCNNNETGRAHVRTPVTTAQISCRILLEKTKTNRQSINNDI